MRGHRTTTTGFMAMVLLLGGASPATFAGGASGSLISESRANATAVNQANLILLMLLEQLLDVLGDGTDFSIQDGSAPLNATAGDLIARYASYGVKAGLEPEELTKFFDVTVEAIDVANDPDVDLDAATRPQLLQTLSSIKADLS